MDRRCSIHLPALLQLQTGPRIYITFPQQSLISAPCSTIRTSVRSRKFNKTKELPLFCTVLSSHRDHAWSAHLSSNSWPVVSLQPVDLSSISQLEQPPLSADLPRLAPTSIRFLDVPYFHPRLMSLIYTAKHSGNLLISIHFHRQFAS